MGFKEVGDGGKWNLGSGTWEICNVRIEEK